MRFDCGSGFRPVVRFLATALRVANDLCLLFSVSDDWHREKYRSTLAAAAAADISIAATPLELFRAVEEICPLCCSGGR